MNRPTVRRLPALPVPALNLCRPAMKHRSLSKAKSRARFWSGCSCPDVKAHRLPVLQCASSPRKGAWMSMKTTARVWLILSLVVAMTTLPISAVLADSEPNAPGTSVTFDISSYAGQTVNDLPAEHRQAFMQAGIPTEALIYTSEPDESESIVVESAAANNLQASSSYTCSRHNRTTKGVFRSTTRWCWDGHDIVGNEGLTKSINGWTNLINVTRKGFTKRHATPKSISTLQGGIGYSYHTDKAWARVEECDWTILGGRTPVMTGCEYYDVWIKKTQYGSGHAFSEAG